MHGITASSLVVFIGIATCVDSLRFPTNDVIRASQLHSGQDGSRLKKLYGFGGGPRFSEEHEITPVGEFKFSATGAIRFSKSAFLSLDCTAVKPECGKRSMTFAEMKCCGTALYLIRVPISKSGPKPRSHRFSMRAAAVVPH